jgi:hypothetical protein
VNLTDIRAGLEANLSTVNGIAVYSEWPEEPRLPAACIVSDDPYIEPYLTFTMARVYLIIAVIVSKLPDVARAQRNLDGLLSSDLPNAVRGPDMSLGGSADSVVWTGTSGLKEIQIGGVGYLGHEMSVNAIVDR